MRKVLALLLSLVMTLTLLVPATWAEEKPAAGYQLPASLKGKTVILHTNDVHGAIDKYAKVAALKNECYDRGASAVVLLDAGDFSQGSTYVSLSKGATAVELMNAVGYDAVTLGNHEFDYGFPPAEGESQLQRRRLPGDLRQSGGRRGCSHLRSRRYRSRYGR